MRNVVSKFQRQTGVHASIEILGDGAQLAPEQQLQVLFILQEALSNVRKHAQASEVQIRVENHRDFSMTVQDDGSGFDPATVAQKGEGHVGLRIMRERAERLAAQFSIQSDLHHGTTIALHLKREERLVA